MPAPQGRIAGEIVITVPLDPYLSLRALSTYGGISVRKLRDCLNDAIHPLPCYRLGGKIVVRRSEFDAWITAFRHQGDPDLDTIVSQTLADLRARS